MPNCPLCKNSNHKLQFKDNGYNVLTCQTCALMFIDPYPPLQDRYDTVKDYSHGDMSILGAEKHYQYEKQFYKKYFDPIYKCCKTSESILDVGCGTGYLLERLQKSPNLKRVGLELNESRAKLARNHAQCEILETPVESLEHSPFDVITLINVLSHIPDFDLLFNSFRRLLKPGGRLILKVGEVSSDVQQNDEMDWCIPDHLHFLGLETLQYIGKKYGFEILHHQRQPYYEDLFSKERWRSPGRSKVKNLIKTILVKIGRAHV